MRWAIRIVPVVSFLSITFCCGIPKDSRESYELAEHNGLKVGVVNNPPFSYFNKGRATGYEVTLLNEFAKKENLVLEYLEGSETELVKKLEEAEIHLVIGGFEKRTAWKKKTGQTMTYDSKNHVILIPKGENRLVFELEQFFNSKQNL